MQPECDSSDISSQEEVAWLAKRRWPNKPRGGDLNSQEEVI